MEAHTVIETAFSIYNVPASRGMLIRKKQDRAPKHYNDIAHARYIVFDILIQDHEWSSEDIAELFGMDRTSVMYGIERIHNALPGTELYEKHYEVKRILRQSILL